MKNLLFLLLVFGSGIYVFACSNCPSQVVKPATVTTIMHSVNQYASECDCKSCQKLKKNPNSKFSRAYKARGNINQVKQAAAQYTK